MNQTYFDWVYEVTKQIPKGKVTTYGFIADYLALGSARMVGWALRHANQKTPAHRVVNRKGELSGRHHFRPPERMAQLLRSEGVEVKDDKILYFEKHLWIPSENIHEDIDLS